MGQAKKRGTREQRIAQAKAAGRIRQADWRAERNNLFAQRNLLMSFIAALVKESPEQSLVVPGLTEVSLNPPFGLDIKLSEDKDTATITLKKEDHDENARAGE